MGDAFVKALLHDSVDILKVAHHGRRRPAELNTALELGAPPDFQGVTCAEPGCHRTYGLQWDHKDPCANGGVTSLENLQPLCTPHHCEKTERDRRAGLLMGTKDERGP
jgi:5-methylcytosine-specific restriction endonuclease McrA